MKAVTASQMRALDSRTIESGTAGRVLMERAGKGVVDALLHRRIESRGPIVILAGKGNNGGDAFVVARHLAQRTDAPITLLLACNKSEIKGDALHHFRTVPKSVKVGPVSRLSVFLCTSSTLTIVDGLLGTGLSGEVRSPCREIIERVNALPRAFVVAIDIPSGLHADTGEPLGTAIRADLTVTMGLPKIGLLKPAAGDRVGELEVVDIGIPPEFTSGLSAEAEFVTGSELAPLFPRRKRSAHKGDFGHVLVVAGAEGYHGAAVLCAESAARMGAGLVTLGVPRRIDPVVAGQCREVMVRPFADTTEGSFAENAADELAPWFERCSVVALGPGLSQQQNTQRFARAVVEACPLPLVIDADGLNAIAGRTDLLKKRKAPTVLTPHPGEMARLIGKTTKEVQADRWGAARSFSEEFRVTVVLKGAGTTVASPGNPLQVNLTGGPALAKGGSGDILTGMLGSLLAQGLSPFDAARAAVFLHGRAADMAARELGERCVLASDVMAQVAGALAGVEAR